MPLPAMGSLMGHSAPRAHSPPRGRKESPGLAPSAVVKGTRCEQAAAGPIEKASVTVSALQGPCWEGSELTSPPEAFTVLNLCQARLQAAGNFS